MENNIPNLEEEGEKGEECPTFEKSYVQLMLSITPANPFIVSCDPSRFIRHHLVDIFDSVHILTSNSTCQNARHLRVITQTILEGGGDGVVLRKPKSIYEHGRTENIVKIKVH